MTQLLKGYALQGASIRLKQIGKSCYRVELYLNKVLQTTWESYNKDEAEMKYDHAKLYMIQQQHEITVQAIEYVRDNILHRMSQ